MEMSMRDYLRLRASQMLLMERDIRQMNSEMASQTQHPELKQMLQRHGDPTERQISNLERVMERLGGHLGPSQNAVSQALMQAHRTFMDMHPPQEIVDLHHALEADEVEHMEMSSYNGMMQVAKQLGENDIANMLQDNLRDEQSMCGTLESHFSALMRAASPVMVTR